MLRRLLTPVALVLLILWSVDRVLLAKSRCEEGGGIWDSEARTCAR